MSLDKLKRALFCRHCTEINVMCGQVTCTKEGCQCDAELDFVTILDFYANLYFHLDNLNFIQHRTIFGEDEESVKEVETELEERWLNHQEGHLSRYNREAYWALQPDTLGLFKGTLTVATSEKDLLLRMMGWLKVLDETSKPIREQLEEDGRLPVDTIRGPLLHRRSSPLIEYVEEQPGFKRLIDPNYLLLHRHVTNFYLAKRNYSYYTVVHKSARISRDMQMTELKFAFLPSQFDLTQDYTLDCNQKPDADGYLPFAFTGVVNKAQYDSDVETMFDHLLNENPVFIILPEFLTPLDLQEKLKARLLQKFHERYERGEKHKTQMLMTGSFHVTCKEISQSACSNSDRLYNYAQLTDGEGTKLLDVYKMNQFVLHKSPTFPGALEPFQEHNGRERNAYDQREITLIDTLFGRMAFLICVDFINSNVAEVLIDRDVDLIFVMSMTENPAGGKFERRMQELGERSHAMIVVCNHLGKSSIKSDDPRIVVYVPGFKPLFTASEACKVYKLSEIVARVSQTQNNSRKKLCFARVKHIIKKKKSVQ